MVDHTQDDVDSWRLGSRAWTVVPLAASVAMLIPFFPASLGLSLIAVVSALLSSRELKNWRAWVIGTSVWCAVVFLISVLGFLFFVSFADGPFVDYESA